MIKKSAILIAALAVSACETTGDPADGGFLAGVSGLLGGGYQERIYAEEAALQQEQAAAAALQAQQQQTAAQTSSIAAQITRLRAQHTQLRLSISAKAAELRSAGVVLTSGMTARVSTVVNLTPYGGNDAARLAALQTAIADARALAADLARLA